MRSIGSHYFIAHISTPLLDDLIADGSAIYIDVEGNFFMVPYNVSLTAIKKKIVQNSNFKLTF